MLALLYHRIGTGKHSNSLTTIRAHFSYLKEHFTIVLPGDPLPKKDAICLTFDDATYDFYHYVYPLLQEMDIRVILGVPVRYILPSTILIAEERLSIPYPLMMQDGIFDKKAPFCTWKELVEMTQSGFVEVASHSFSHANLTFPFVDLQREIIQSKKILEEQLPQAISTFIYPFGRYTRSVHELVKNHYAFSFRIGFAYNKNWDHSVHPLSRISADCLASPSHLFSLSKLLKYKIKSILKNPIAL